MNEWTAFSMNKNMKHLLHKLEVMLQSIEQNKTDTKSGEVCITRSIESVPVCFGQDTLFTMCDVSIDFFQHNTKYRINSFINNGKTFNLDPPITGAIGKVEAESKIRENGIIFNRVSNFKSTSPQDADVERTLQDTSNPLTGCIIYNSNEKRDDFLLMLSRDYVKMNTEENMFDMLSYHIYLGNPDDNPKNLDWILFIRSKVPDNTYLSNSNIK